MSQYIPNEQLAAIKETTKRIDRYMRNLNRRPVSASDIAQVSLWLDQINGLCNEVDEKNKQQLNILQAVRDQMKFEANSEKGIVARIDYAIKNQD